MSREFTEYEESCYLYGDEEEEMFFDDNETIGEEY